MQKAVRDRLENIKVTDIYYGICWFATLSSIVLLVIGLWNATLLPSEKGYAHYNIPLSITTISKNNYFEFFGENIFIKDILLIEGENVANQEYFSGIKEIGEFKNDEYLVILTSNNYDWAWDNL